MLSTSTVEVKEKSNSINKYLSVGVQQLKIYSMEAIKANNTDSYKVRFNVETGPVTTEGFVPEEGHTGLVGRIHTIYLATDEQKKEFLVLIATLATKLGVKADVDAIQAADIPSFVAAVQPLLVGRFFWGKVIGEEYDKGQNEDGSRKYPGVNLKWARFGAFASLDEGITKIKPFNKDDKYDYKKLEVNTSESTVSSVTSGEDLPF